MGKLSSSNRSKRRLVPGEYPFGEPAALPPVCCVGDFESPEQDVLYYSYLAVIWFQHDDAFPLGPEAERALVALDWEKLAQRQER